MESTEAARQLEAVERLRQETVGESLRGDRRAPIVLAGATVVFLASYAIDSPWQRVIAPVLWLAFVIGWSRWLRHANRAHYARPRQVARHHIVEWSAVVLASVGIVVGARVSWLLAGVLLAVLGAIVGIFEAVSARRELRARPSR